jgi:hypothetical protein
LGSGVSIAASASVGDTIVGTGASILTRVGIAWESLDPVEKKEDEKEKWDRARVEVTESGAFHGLFSVR